MARIDLTPSTRSVGGLVRMAALFGILFAAAEVLLDLVLFPGDAFGIADGIQVIATAAAVGGFMAWTARTRRRPYGLES